jgi:SnoaL-like protein
MDDDAGVRRLLDRAAIVEVVVALANALDEQDWARVRSLLADEVDVDYSEFRGEPPTRIAADAYVASRLEGLRGLRTLHTSTNHEVEVDGDRGTCRSAHHIVRVDPVTGARLQTWGTYRHRLARSGGAWRVTGIVQTVTLLDGDRSVHGALRR